MNPLYAKIEIHYPNMPDRARTDKMHLGRGTLSRIKKGEIPGLRAAKWMADNFPEDCTDMYHAVLAQNKIDKLAGGKQSAETRAEDNSKFIIPQPVWDLIGKPQPECSNFA